MSELLDRAKASLEGVTEGPWEPVEERGNPGYSPFYGVRSAGDQPRRVVFAQSDWEGYGNGSTKADAEFIAAARQLVPELIAEVERRERALQGRVRELERERDDHLETAEIMRRTRERAERLQAEIDAMKKQASVSCCTLSYEEGFSQCLSCQGKLR
ncbi:hypothetical protein [Mycobacteroides abscessus]|uniref:hypothetical protein n=1 Tax=Mycobacteroides abscessus TaxID=36809 RepID=UPI0019D1F4C0|nr:hypothetical protein [Mycobacteroides abscessus]MDB2213837.1 hypothetical protein [Mycobacteroides abscessus subsp. massiliense]QSM87562.1 hypothetical protein I3U44_17180 [Mycobacteroides abscessus subsp. bolletii]WJJ55542.1 Ea22-like protein [Mycobacterium phage prophiT49-2]